MLLSLLSALALAAPTQLHHTGRLLDTAGVPLDGSFSVVLELFDTQSGGSALWSESQPGVVFDNGYFAVDLGGSVPLDDSDLDQSDLWLELTVDGSVVGRQQVMSVPFARLAGTATNVSGGVVRASEIWVNGNLVVDNTGTLALGSSLDSLGCATGQLPVFVSSVWTCTDQASWTNLAGVPSDLLDGDNDTQLSELQVDTFVENNGFAAAGDLQALDTSLAAIAKTGQWGALQGVPGGFADDVDDDTLMALVGCAAGDIPVYGGGTWSCAAPTIDAANLTGTLSNSQLPTTLNVGSVVASGSIQVGAVGSCTSGAAGSLAWNGRELQFCDGTNWRNIVSTGPGDGSSPAWAGKSCKSVHSAYPSLPSGVYWIDPDGDGDTGDAWRAYCDMTRDGGGWTLVLQNNVTISTVGTPYDWSTTINSTTVRAGVLSNDLTTFDLQIGLAEWPQIGVEGRVEVGNTPAVPTKQALYSLLTVDPANSYTLSLSGETLVLGGSSPGLNSYHNGQRWSASDAGNACPANYDHAWWYLSCWSGSFWGSDLAGYSPAAYWDGSGADYWPWGAIWLR